MILDLKTHTAATSVHVYIYTITFRTFGNLSQVKLHSQLREIKDLIVSAAPFSELRLKETTVIQTIERTLTPELSNEFFYLLRDTTLYSTFYLAKSLNIQQQQQQRVPLHLWKAEILRKRKRERMCVPKSRGKVRTFDRASSVGARWRTPRGKKEQFNAALCRVFGTTLKLWQSRKHAERRATSRR